jgi:hypothetical protein
MAREALIAIGGALVAVGAYQLLGFLGFSGCAFDCSLVKRMPRWHVDIRGKELQQLGTVDAPNAWEALAKAVELFDIRRPL